MINDKIESVIRKIVEEVLVQQHGAVTSIRDVTATKPKLFLLVDEKENNMEQQILADITDKFEIVTIDGILHSLEKAKGNCDQIDSLLIPNLSKSNLAKVALGIADNDETKIIQKCLERNIDIVIWKEGLESSSLYTSTAYSKMFVSYERIIQEFGIKIVAKGLFREKLNRDNTKQHCLTTQDINKINPNINYRINRNTIITKLAQEQLKEKNIQLIYEY